jgi:type IV fimbrial biogenesis protein FimT
MYLEYPEINTLKINHGFTLVELMIAISIASILLSLAVPSFSSFIKRNRLATASDELFASLSFARSEALKQRKTITICARNPTGTTTCDTTGSNEDYAKGWLIFHDNSSPANNTYESTDDLIRVIDPFKGAVSITGDSSHVASVSFGLSGRIIGGAATFSIKSGSTVFRTLEVNRSGSTYYN